MHKLFIVSFLNHSLWQILFLKLLFPCYHRALLFTSFVTPELKAVLFMCKGSCQFISPAYMCIVY